MKRLIVVSDGSLIAEAIVVGLRKSGEFRLLAHTDERHAETAAILRAQPEVVLLDEMDRSPRVLELITGIGGGNQRVAVIMLTMTMDPEWLDEIFDAGAVAAVSKATHPAVLGTLIRETLRGNVVRAHRPSGQKRRPRSATALPEVASLTRRELEVLGFLASGSTNGEIARKLWVTEQTVKFHVSNVYRKLQVTNRTEASHYAHVNGLVGTAYAGVAI